MVISSEALYGNVQRLSRERVHSSEWKWGLSERTLKNILFLDIIILGDDYNVERYKRIRRIICS